MVPFISVSTKSTGPVVQGDVVTMMQPGGPTLMPCITITPTAYMQPGGPTSPLIITPWDHLATHRHPSTDYGVGEASP